MRVGSARKKRSIESRIANRKGSAYVTAAKRNKRQTAEANAKNPTGARKAGTARAKEKRGKPTQHVTSNNDANGTYGAAPLGEGRR